MKKNNLLKMNLQYFADDITDQVADLKSNDKTDKGELNNGEHEFIAPGSQSELDSIVNKSVHTALENAKKKFEQDQEKAIEKALKKEKNYSELSAEQREQQELADERGKLEAERAEFEFGKLVMQVKEDLINKDLPVELTELASVFAIPGDVDKSLANVVKIEQAFNKGYNRKFNEHMRQSEPQVGGRTGGNNNFGAQLAKATGGNKQGKVF